MPNACTLSPNQQPHIQHLEDTEDGRASSPQSDKNRYPQGHPCCPPLIKSRQTLKFCTCLVFLVTVLTSVTVITASTWLMLDCRRKLRSMHAVLEFTNSKQCTNLGLQVLFACCVVLFAVFGLGCIGRQMTGYAMMIISGVAIFQSAMTLAFDDCQTGVKDEFMTSISTSLGECRLGSSNPPFELREYYFAGPDTRLASAQSGHIEKRDTRQDGEKNNGVIQSKNPRIFLAERLFQKQRDIRMKEDDYHVKKIISELSLSYKNSDFVQNSGLTCDKNSAYMSVLARFLSREDVSNCIRLCESYQDVCSPSSPENTLLDLSSGAEEEVHQLNESINFTKNETNSENKMLLSTIWLKGQENKIKNEKGEDLEEKDDFGFHVRSCGTKMWNKIRQFCFYDNVIFMPLSLGGPVFYFLLSLAFMYLGHCDKVMKEQAELLRRDKSVCSLLPASLSETALSRKISPQPSLNVEKNISVFSSLFEPKVSRTNTSGDCGDGKSSARLIPKLRVVNERTSLDCGDKSRKYENYGMDHSCCSTMTCNRCMKNVCNYGNESNADEDAVDAVDTSFTSMTSNLDMSVLSVPSTSVHSRMTSELYISDSD